MKVHSVTLRNFRSYRHTVAIPIGDFTSFIGKNDVGKSSILEALDIFFSDKSGAIDGGDHSIGAPDPLIEIGCTFTALPDPIVLDSDAETTLAREFMLNADGFLELRKRWDCSRARLSASVVLVAHHPTVKDASDLLSLNNSQLKERCRNLGVDLTNVNKSENPALREAIRKHISDLELRTMEIDLNKDHGKDIWKEIQTYLPHFALFRADRSGLDNDPEAQDPMKVAVQEALRDKEISLALRDVESKVRNRVSMVANLTVSEMKSLNPDLTLNVQPSFEDPKWSGAFKPGLIGDDGIPLNKRGSGIRRLVLLGFLSAEAKRRVVEEKKEHTVFAIEEPETAQHPDVQKKLLRSLYSLSDEGSSQVLITTHNPALGALLPVESIRWVHSFNRAESDVALGTEKVWKDVAESLGVLPDSRVRVLIGVEGYNDVEFLKEISEVIYKFRPDLPNLKTSPYIAFCPRGGSSLKHWVQYDYLKELNKHECHLYDRDKRAQYTAEVDAINRKGPGHYASLTSTRTIENYLHPEAICEEYQQHGIQINIVIDDDSDVPEVVAEAVHRASSTSTDDWASLTPKEQKEKKERAKKRLNLGAVKLMNEGRLKESDPQDFIIGWFEKLQEIIATEDIGTPRRMTAAAGR